MHSSVSKIISLCFRVSSSPNCRGNAKLYAQRIPPFSLERERFPLKMQRQRWGTADSHWEERWNQMKPAAKRRATVPSSFLVASPNLQRRSTFLSILIWLQHRVGTPRFTTSFTSSFTAATSTESSFIRHTISRGSNLKFSRQSRLE